MTKFDNTRLPHASNYSISISCNIMSHHATDLEFSHIFIKQQVKIEVDGILLIRVMNL